MDEPEFKRITLRQWLTGCMCWETKSGFLLILAGGLLLWFTGWKLPVLGWHAGWAVLALGVIIQTAGLGRDCKIVYKNRKK